MSCENLQMDSCGKFSLECRSSSCNPLISRDLPARRVIKGLCNELIMTPQHLENYMKNFLRAIRLGLGKETNADAIVKCFPTYVQELPDGTETGRFLALDLGGSNFRVLLVKFEEGEYEIEQDIYAIEEELMTGPGEALFDFIAECIATFATDKGVAKKNLPLGFTFSFPLIQKSLNVGILERWTKGFSCSGVIGNDVVQLLNDAIGRREDVKVQVVAVLNDTTGTMVACSYKDKDCKIGLIIGTGTNGCYVEKQYNAELFDEEDEGSGVVIINLESGAFGDGGELDFCRTEYDEEVDKASINPGHQLQEKMISGMYLGELVRLAVVKFTKMGIMFNGVLSQKFRTPGAFETRFVSEIETDEPCTYENVTNVCKELEMEGTEEDYQDLRFICSCFSKRAAHLLSGLLVVLIRKMDYRKTTIGIDGTLYKNHPHFHNLLMRKIQELLIPDTYKFNLLLSEDGSGVGAALIAAVATRGTFVEEEDEEEEPEEGEEGEPEE